ncbi:MAG: hypothetical protein JWQ98_479 [Chlorobi bacterium]|jgi:hypothetical protein|nr:hypothetical protein [Chlorobiota bacterium]
METPSEKSSMMFASMVMMFNSQAMMAMGKLANPMTGKVDRELQGAQFMIDLLAMIEERTSGNLTDEESRMLTTALRDLRLNYVAEVNRDKNPSSPHADTELPPGTGGEIPDNVA